MASHYRSSTDTREGEVLFSTRSSRTSSPEPKSSPNHLGLPIAKKRLHVKGIVAVTVSLSCLALAVASVAADNVAWFLGVGTRQLIVLGFLLSAMSLCLNSVTSVLFLHLEAKFGSSKLQNYDGLLRNQIMTPKFSMVWRSVLLLMLGIPIALSVAYKSFYGGQTSMNITASKYVNADSSYGMFAPPGLQFLGAKTGVSLFFNAVLPFMVRSQPDDIQHPPLPEPGIPPGQQAYGFNVLLQSNESTAVLDMPMSSYVSAVQQRLRERESWTMTARVLGTVAKLNNSMISDPQTFNDTLMAECHPATVDSGTWNYAAINSGTNVVLMNNFSLGHTYQYIALLPATGTTDHDGPDCVTFSQYAHRFDLTRQSCTGTWNVNRSSIYLVDGNCDSAIVLPPEQQLVITNKAMYVDFFYMGPLVEFLAAFDTARRDSQWKVPYMATALAAMLWSRITVMNGEPNSVPVTYTRPPAWNISTDAEPLNTKLGLSYPTHESVKYFRPTLKKNVWLYVVLTLQPVLTIFAFLITAALHSMPLDTDFGLVSILSGIKRSNLDVLGGAALSGKLKDTVRLVMRPYHDNEKGSIEYEIVPDVRTKVRNGQILGRTVYH